MVMNIYNNVIYFIKVRKSTMNEMIKTILFFLGNNFVGKSYRNNIIDSLTV